MAKEYKTRAIQKNDTSENWAKAVNFVPLKGELILYTDLNKIKIGDGTTKVNDLPFLSSYKDWNENDETAEGYIVNRPGGYYGEEYPTITIENILYTKVSETIPDWIAQTFTSETQKINIKCWLNSEKEGTLVQTVETSVKNKNFIVEDTSSPFIIVSKDNSSIEDITFEKGIYFVKIENNYLSGIGKENSLKPEIQWDGNSRKIYKFDKKFLPEDDNLIKVIISDNSGTNVCTSNYTSSEIINFYNANKNIVAEYNGEYFYLSNDASQNDYIAYFCSLEPKYDRNGGKITRVYDAFSVDNSGNAHKKLYDGSLYLEAFALGEVNDQFSLNVNTKGIITVKGLRNDINYDLVTSDQIPTGTSTQYVGFNSENKMTAINYLDSDNALENLAEWAIAIPAITNDNKLFTTNDGKVLLIS